MFIGNVILYFIGRWCGGKLLKWVLGNEETVEKLKKRKNRIATKKTIRKIADWIKKYCDVIVPVIFVFTMIIGATVSLLLIYVIPKKPYVKITDAIDIAVVIKATDEHELEYFYVKTEFMKKTDDVAFYHTDYIGCDDYHTYYSFEYLTATRNNEILQIVEVAK